jgi:type II secretory ATPase GspE/PulE/Tfp pilus assembly ATPase PilB-like protein
VDSDLHEIALVGLPLMRGVAQVVRDLAGPGCAGDAELPGSGRFNFRLDRTVYDVRVESCMTGTGAGCPKITIRLLDKGIRGIDTLGFSSRVLKLWKRVVQLPQGLVLVTGPTGSGKTSTMYAALREINTPDRNIQTAEDPIEIEMPGVNQSSVNHGRVDGQGNVLNFARLLRSILRQDPDNILVGELRDSETADVAVQAALTGHLVFSTLHVVTACDSVERLVSMGIAPYSLGQVVVALSGQRLVERLCPDCKRVVPVTDEARRLFERAGVSDLLKGAMFEPCGCPKCHGTGYCGRVLVAEFFPVMTEEAAMITARARGVDLEDHYKRKGFLTMHQDVLRHVALGNTSLRMVDMVHDREWASGL